MAFYTIQGSRNLYFFSLVSHSSQSAEGRGGGVEFVCHRGTHISSKITEYKHIPAAVFIGTLFPDKATIILNIVHNTFITPKLFIPTNNARSVEFFLFLTVTFSWLLPLGKIFRQQLPFSAIYIDPLELFDKVQCAVLHFHFSSS